MITNDKTGPMMKEQHKGRDKREKRDLEKAKKNRSFFPGNLYFSGAFFSGKRIDLPGNFPMMIENPTEKERQREREEKKPDLLRSAFLVLIDFFVMGICLFVNIVVEIGGERHESHESNNLNF